MDQFLKKRYKEMKKLFIGIDFSKEKFSATAIKASGVEECGTRAFGEFKTTTAGYRTFLKWASTNAEGHEQDT